MKNEFLWYVLAFIGFNVIASIIGYEIIILSLVFAIWWEKVWKATYTS